MSRTHSEHVQAGSRLYTQNLRTAESRWGLLNPAVRFALGNYSAQFGLSVATGDLILLDSNWYVTHVGLLRLARRKHCAGIDVRLLSRFCDAAGSRWAFKATVYKSKSCRGFVGYGDADPSNVSPQVRGAELRIAETRAVNRALRKAYGIGICSIEELGAVSGRLLAAAQGNRAVVRSESANGHHPLRDRLCLLIRKHALDGNLVKAYAAQFCGVSELRQAAREQIASFIKHLAEYAQNDREGLLCQLNSFAPKAVSLAGQQAGAEEQKVAGAA